MESQKQNPCLFSFSFLFSLRCPCVYTRTPKVVHHHRTTTPSLIPYLWQYLAIFRPCCNRELLQQPSHKTATVCKPATTTHPPPLLQRRTTSTHPVCDQKFFTELMKEAEEIAGCFSSRVKRLLHLHISTGLQRYMLRLVHCFSNDQHIMVKQGQMLIEYVTMNAIAIRKILKKYDKVHGSVNGRNFRTKMRAEHIELLQSPWLIELGAFYINSNISSGGESTEFSHQFSCDPSAAQPVMTLKISDYVKLDYNLTCAICLDTVFNPYALSCGHLFCKACACSAASVLLFEGFKTAPPESKCPVCREVGVYANSVHMVELDLLLKNRCKEYWRERLHAERAEMVKQSKDYWDSQTKYVLGF